MKRFFLKLLLLFLPVLSFSQQITFSDPVREDKNTLDFNIIGKVGDNILVFKNVQSRYAVSIYGDDMSMKDKVALDFMPDKSFNVQYVAYPDFFYLIYQYTKKSIVYCMAAKLDANGKLLKDPVEIDTTEIGFLADDRIYKTISSDDKRSILVFKQQKKSGNLNFETILLDSALHVINKSREVILFDDSRDVFGNYLLDNDGGFVFTKSIKTGYRENAYGISLIMKPAMANDFSEKDIRLYDHYVDEIKLKIDNLNKKYIINTFYYDDRSSNIDGVFSDIWDKQADSSLVSVFIPLNDSIRKLANSDARIKIALNNFFIRNIIIRKDGGYIVAAEDYLIQSNNPWNRWDYLYNTPYYSPYGYYMYRPFGYTNFPQVRYYYDNILVMSFDNNAKPEWSTVINKSQYADNYDNSLSFFEFISGGEIHFLYNLQERNNDLLNDNTITPDGTLNRNPPFKNLDKGYDFMPRFGKQIGSRKIVIPCTYRNSVCFALISY